MNVSYSKFRKIISLFVKNEVLRDSLEKLLTGKSISMTELELLELIDQAGIDSQVIEILTDKKPESLSAEEGLKVLLDFFLNTKNSFQNLEKQLLSLGLKLQADKTTA